MDIVHGIPHLGGGLNLGMWGGDIWSAHADGLYLGFPLGRQEPQADAGQGDGTASPAF